MLKGRKKALKAFLVVIYISHPNVLLPDSAIPSNAHRANNQCPCWADYSEQTERQREESLNAWLSTSLGEQRSFVWLLSGTTTILTEVEKAQSLSVTVTHLIPDW
jgi:hypothetical protein